MQSHGGFRDGPAPTRGNLDLAHDDSTKSASSDWSVFETAKDKNLDITYRKLRDEKTCNLWRCKIYLSRHAVRTIAHSVYMDRF
jgi:hypothetical protein